MEYSGSKEFERCEKRPDVYVETAADYTLPDYNGDVRRILFTKAEVHPSGSFENEGSVDFSGIVVYDLVYADSENRINAASFSSDYDFNIKVSEEGRAYADLSVSDFSLRLLGPRKISARAGLVASVTLEIKEDLSPKGTAFEGECMPQVNKEVINAYYLKQSESCEREYAEEICRLDGAISEEVCVAYSTAECIVDCFCLEDGVVAIKGNMRMLALVRSGEGNMILAEKVVKIDESLQFGEGAEELNLIPVINVRSARPNINADEGGCSVVLNLMVDMAVEGVGNKSANLVTDAYMKISETENKYGDFKYTELCTLSHLREEICGNIPRENIDVENLREIICLRAHPSIESCKIEDGSLRIIGEIGYFGIASGTDERGVVSYYPFKTAVEFVKNVNINRENDGKIKIDAKIQCYGANALVDEELIQLSTMAEIKICVLEEKNTSILLSSDVIEGTDFDECSTKITVYYPEPGEKIFDIAKRFHTTVEKITENNPTAKAISDGTAQNVQRLLIY